MKRSIIAFFIGISLFLSHGAYTQAPAVVSAPSPAASGTPAPVTPPDITKLNIDQYQSRAQALVGTKPDLTLKDLGILLSKISIPAGPLSQLDSIGIKTPQILGAPRGFTGIGISGSVVLYGAPLKLTVYVIKKKEGDIGFSASLELPPKWKLSNFSPALSAFDVLSLPTGKFIISSFEYQDPQLAGVTIKRGLNSLSGLELKGPFALIGKLINDSAKFKGALIVEGGEFFLLGHIPQNVTESSFSAIIPFKLGVDFTKIAKVPESVTKIIESIYTEPFSFSVSPKPEIGMRGGIAIKLGTQSEPLRFIASGLLQPTKIRLTGGLESTLELKWLALSKPVFQIDIDQVVVSALAASGLPIPFSGLGFKGGLELGPKGDQRATVSVAANVGISASAGIADLLIEGEAKNLRISDFIYYLSKIAKKPIPTDKMPTLALDEVRLKAAPTKVTIGSTTYEAGIDVSSQISIANSKGSLRFRVDPYKLVMQGTGWVSAIKTPVFVLTGPGLDNKYDTPDDGPLIDMLFSVLAPQNSYMTMKGKLAFPTLNLSHETNLTFGPSKIDTAFTTRVANLFTGDFKIGFEPKNPEKFDFRFNFKQDFLPILTDGLRDAVKELQQEAQASLENLDKQIEVLQVKLNAANKKAQGGISAEIKKTDDKIKKVVAQLKVLKKEYNRKCKGVNAIKNAPRCTKLSFNLAKKGTEYAGLKGYKEALLKPSKKAAEGLLNEISRTTGQINDSQILKKIPEETLKILVRITDIISKAAKTIQLKEVGGLWTGEKAKKGISPQITLEVLMDIPTVGKKTFRVQNVEFDFRNPKRSIVPIAKQIIDTIKRLLK